MPFEKAAAQSPAHDGASPSQPGIPGLLSAAPGLYSLGWIGLCQLPRWGASYSVLILRLLSSSCILLCSPENKKLIATYECPGFK